MAKPDGREHENDLDYEWPGVGRLEILFRGPRTALLRFDPDMGEKGCTEAAQRAGEGDHHQPSKTDKPAPTSGHAI